MIVFDLKCGKNHRFEAWFKDSASFEEQAAAGEVACALCGDTKVRKALMAPNISTGEGREKAAHEKAVKAHPAREQFLREAHETLHRLRQHVEKTHEHVGERFPEEARRIHYGEVASREIYGEATLEDAKALTEEGIQVFPLGPARTDA